MKKLFAIGMFVLSLYAKAQVGIGTTSPNSTLDVRGSFSAKYRSITASTTAAADNAIVYTGIAAATVTLPNATTCSGREYWIKQASTTLPTPTLTISTVSSQTIDGLVSPWTLDEPNEVVRIASDGSNWIILSQEIPVAKSDTTGGAWLQGGNNVPSVKAIGTIGNFDLPFITNNTEVMRLKTTGYLGLGTTAPSGRFHLVTQGSDAANNYYFDDYGSGTTQGFYIRKSRGTFSSPLDLAINDQIGFLRFVPRYNGSLGTSAISSVESYYKGSGTDSLSDLRFYTSAAERMRMDEFGNVAIGATSFNAANPEKLLVDAGTTTSYNVIAGRGSINNYLQLNIQNRSDGTSASSDVVASNNSGTETSYFVDMGINSSGYSNSSLPVLDGANNAYLYSTGYDFIIGNATSGKNMVFFTNGFATTDEKMRITSTGNVGIGTTAPTDKLTVAGIIAPSADNTYSLGKSGARWSAVWSANGTIQTSDMRLKTNIKPLNYGLREVLQMHPVRYNWKTDPTANAKIGLIAQEVQQLVPEVVIGNEKTEMLGMNYAELIPVLINAVKELDQKIKRIEKEIKSIKEN
jgi:Chaperone of endosialidase